MSELATLQRWLTSIIIRPGKFHDKILAADHTYELDHTRVVRSSPAVSGTERMQIYARGYVLRLMECLRADYPILQHLLGDALFDMFAQAYLAHVPPQSYSLFDLGTNFPDFLLASRPQHTAEQQQFDLPIELARLERARAEVYRSKGTESNTHGTPYEQPVFFMFESEKLATPPCLRLLKLQYPLISFVKAVEQGEQPPIPPPRDSLVAVSRKNYTIHMQELEPWQWHFLHELETTGNYVQAVQESAPLSAMPQDTLWANLMLWVPVAVDLGYISKQS